MRKKNLLLQFAKDSSDRQIERGMRDNMTLRESCGNKKEDGRLDATYFTKLGKPLGTKGTASLHNPF